jgi:hypothetical protein
MVQNIMRVLNMKFICIYCCNTGVPNQKFAVIDQIIAVVSGSAMCEKQYSTRPSVYKNTTSELLIALIGVDCKLTNQFWEINWWRHIVREDTSKCNQQSECV